MKKLILLSEELALTEEEEKWLKGFKKMKKPLLILGLVIVQWLLLENFLTICLKK